jgi:hypothetical protein
MRYKAHLSENGQAGGEVRQYLARRPQARTLPEQIAEDKGGAGHFGRDARDRNRSEWREMKAEFREVRDDLEAAIHDSIPPTREKCGFLKFYGARRGTPGVRHD